MLDGLRKTIVPDFPPNVSWVNAPPIANGYTPRAGSTHGMKGTSQDARSEPLCDQYEDLGMIPGRHWGVFTILPRWFTGDPIYITCTLGRSSITSSGEPSRRINK